MPDCPALLIAAPASGQGKTSVSAGLARHLRNQGRRVRAFKWGPDFLDPSWLAAASGHAVDTLDLAMGGARDVAARLAHAAAQADVLLIESAMGLFDGDPCAADLAQRFDLPILLVMDASHMAETFGALAGGLMNHRPGLRFAGVLANRVGSDRHAQLLQRGLALAPGVKPRWLGGIARQQQALPARQLGLVAAPQLPDTEARLAQLAQAVAASALGEMPWHQWQDWRVHFEVPGRVHANAPGPVGTNDIPGHADPLPQLLSGRTLAIAHDAAFSFVYPANLACLQALGARLALFSPLAGEALPPCDALWLPGGYPELHAPALAGLAPLREQIACHVAAGKPVWAECGGMLALAERICWPARGTNEPLWGLLPAVATQHERLQGLGMQAWRTPQGLLRGHGFHYSSLSTTLTPMAHTQRLRGEAQCDSNTALEAIYAHGSIRASYFHAWFPSNPQAVAALFTGQA